MLGEQLIKNERIALIELIKNAYDADAGWVKVTFQGFGDDYAIEDDSKIIIEDDGHGMSEEIMKNHWMNPATPEKKARKKKGNSATERGRVIQGEKGIGRFSALKLGKKVNVISRVKGSKQECCLSFDFSRYEEDFTEDEKYLFLDELSAELVNQKPLRIVASDIILGTRRQKRVEHGTVLEISHLKDRWSPKNVKAVYSDLTKLQPIFLNKTFSDFEVLIYKDDIYQGFEENYREKIQTLLDENAVIRIESGVFDAAKMEYRYSINGVEKKVSLKEARITGLKVFNDRFGKAGEFLDQKRSLGCGCFGFDFFVFDFSSQALGKHKLNREEKALIKNNRIYLYRDGIRVYPYGEPDDDWLRIDTYRGVVKAGQFLSNDQVIGVVNISQKDNPELKDKTNREGLIEEGNATEDFIVILQAFLAHIRKEPYRAYTEKRDNQKKQDAIRSKKIASAFEELKSAVEGNSKAWKVVSETEKMYNAEKSYLVRRAEMTEDLAGVGLSVETASHDIMAIIGRIAANLDGLIRDLMSNSEIDKEILLKELESARGGVSFVRDQLKDIQLLFTSSKQRPKPIRVKESVEKIERIYKRLLKKENIEFNLVSEGSPLVAKTTDAVLLQLLLNLFDNAAYWLMETDRKDKKIEILLDGAKGQMTFSDNGPGIHVDDIPYIFEPFYSGKGEEGRGLGLYIARQLLERNQYSIDVARLESEKVLSGANFIVNFFEEDE
jgi:signal transduction histidine kinase